MGIIVPLISSELDGKEGLTNNSCNLMNFEGPVVLPYSGEAQNEYHFNNDFFWYFSKSRGFITFVSYGFNRQ